MSTPDFRYAALVLSKAVLNLCVDDDEANLEIVRAMLGVESDILIHGDSDSGGKDTRFFTHLEDARDRLRSGEDIGTVVATFGLSLGSGPN